MIAIALQPALDAPLYEQIARAIRDGIARGDLRPGEALPTVRGMAGQIGVNQNTVNRAYALLRAEGLIEGRNSQGTRVARDLELARITNVRDAELRLGVARFIGDMVGHGYGLAEIEAAFFGQRERWGQDAAGRAADGPPAPPRGRTYLGLGSHDLTLDLLLSYAGRLHPECHMMFGAVGSMGGLSALARGEADFATAHLFDAQADDYNLPFVRKLMPSRRLALLTLAERTTGWVVAKGNPKGIHDARDLARKGMRMVNRQSGAGTRVLLDELLRAARVSKRDIDGYAREEKTHLALAAAIASGDADAGIGIEASARAYDLDFIPVTRERFEIVLPRGHALLGLFRQILAREDFRRAAAALGGYELAATGRVRYA